MSVENQGVASEQSSVNLNADAVKIELQNLLQDAQSILGDLRKTKQHIDDLEEAALKSKESISMVEDHAVSEQAKINKLSEQIAQEGQETTEARKQSGETLTLIQSNAETASSLSGELVEAAKVANNAISLVGDAETLLEGLRNSKQLIDELEVAASKSKGSIDSIETSVVAVQTKTQTLSEQIAKEAQEIADARKLSGETLSAIQSDSAVTSSVSSEISEKAKLATQALSKIQADQSASEAQRIAAETAHAGAQEAANSAKVALDAVRASETELNELKAQVAIRLKQIEDGLAGFNTRLTEYEGRIDAQSKNVAETVEAANGMLSGATSASLATSFKSEADVLDRKGDKAQFLFSVGIIGLILSLAPLLLLLFGDGDNVVTIESILARSILVAPAVWFCSFMARQHGALFELRHHYGHKHNMTFSMNAFRKLANDDQTGITKEVFQNVSKNPADVLRRHRRMSDGPFAAMMPDSSEEKLETSEQVKA